MKTQIDLALCVGFYKRVLGLQEWRIKVSWCRQCDVSSKNRVAEADYRLGDKTAVIRLVRLEDRKPDFYFGEDYDAELLIVHELVHIRFAGSGESHDEWEVEAMAKGLIGMRRGEHQHLWMGEQ